MRAIGLDVGERRIGVAAGDTESTVAVQVGAIDRTAVSDEIAEILALAAERDAGTIVVGLPLSMNGRVGAQAQITQEFIDALASRTELAVETVDERLTSVEAERRMRERTPAGRGKRRAPAKGAIDAGAAVLILQAWLDGGGTSR
jgi:putative Holliday junction resolvase